LEKKWKHAVDFGITTTKRNPTTLAEFQGAITKHLDDAGTVVKGTYGWLPDSVVHFNPSTNLAVVLDKAGNFVTGWRLTPGTAQFEKFIKDGFLK
jgi:filamentous hemagglutinin